MNDSQEVYVLIRRGWVPRGDRLVYAFGHGWAARVLTDHPRHIDRRAPAVEYPASATPGPVDNDVTDALDVATQARDASLTILGQQVLTPWSA
ncbi:MAG TPA: hypothetical protein VGS19_12360 [Streptosporangiaceae bacterium]|nr:hypothetical protein [Streptosporangiaceae bacterium]